MKATAVAHGAASIVNGIPCGKGAAFGIALELLATVEMTGEPGRFEVGIEDDPGEDSALAANCARLVLERLGLEGSHGAKVSTRSRIPISRGLKSSSAASNAIVLAAFKALGETVDDRTVIELGVRACLAAGVTVTGAYDDACATYFGDVVVADNDKRTILAQYRIDGPYDVLIHVPARKIRKRDLDLSRLRAVRAPAEIAVRLALEKDFLGGMLVNGLACSAALGLRTDATLNAMRAGAASAGVSGTGPATVAISPPDRTDAVMAALRETGGDDAVVIRTSVNSGKAR